MKKYKSIRHLRNFLDPLREQGLRIGFVPTMGALHEGHASLVELSNEQTDITVCSIFVNPTQFNDADDLKKYPRTLKQDYALLKKVDCEVVFVPSVSEIYPKGKGGLAGMDFGLLEQVMEGKQRPGHFAGVAQVLSRLLEIVEPDAMFMGQKDYQQFAIVKTLLRHIKSPTKLVMAPTVREPDGLAMSSRNKRLTKEERKIAPVISRALFHAKEKIGRKTIAEIKQEALCELDIPQLQVEYFEIVDGISLQPIDSTEYIRTVVACTAVRLGQVRLIDNVILE